MKDRKTLFITKAVQLHQNKYDYSKVDYVNNKTKVTIICPVHGEFEQTPNNHLKGNGCPKCYYDKLSSNKDLFVEKANIIHSNKYSYDKFIYTKATSKSIITCPIHGDFEQTPNSHLNGSGCPICAKEKASENFRKPLEQWITEAQIIHGNNYDYSKVCYKSCKDKVLIKCNNCGNEFYQEAHAHISQKQGCPICAKTKKESKGEKLIKSILLKLNIPFKEQYRIKDNDCNYILDFYIEYNNNVYVIEYNGEQHYKEVKVFGGKERFEKQIIRDNKLRIFCNNCNYKLLEIKYDCKDEEVFNLIKNLLCQ